MPLIKEGFEMQLTSSPTAGLASALPRRHFHEYHMCRLLDDIRGANLTISIVRLALRPSPALPRIDIVLKKANSIGLGQIKSGEETATDKRVEEAMVQTKEEQSIMGNMRTTAEACWKYRLGRTKREDANFKSSKLSLPTLPRRCYHEEDVNLRLIRGREKVKWESLGEKDYMNGIYALRQKAKREKRERAENNSYVKCVTSSTTTDFSTNSLIFQSLVSLVLPDCAIFAYFWHVTKDLCVNHFPPFPQHLKSRISDTLFQPEAVLQQTCFLDCKASCTQ
jgi:hypothetical protein